MRHRESTPSACLSVFDDGPTALEGPTPSPTLLLLLLLLLPLLLPPPPPPREETLAVSLIARPAN